MNMDAEIYMKNHANTIKISFSLRETQYYIRFIIKNVTQVTKKFAIAIVWTDCGLCAH